MATTSICKAALFFNSLFLNYMQDDMQHEKARWHAGKAPEDKAQFDIIIIGAGSAGCVLATRLSERSDLRILILEAGGEVTKTQDMPGYAFSVQDTGEDTVWKFESTPSEKFGGGEPLFLPRGKGLGGCSTINYMVYARGDRTDFDSWAAMGNYGWDFESVLRYFKKSENLLDTRLAANTEFRSTGGPLPVETAVYKDTANSAFLEATVNLGYPKVDYNAQTMIGSAPIQFTTNGGIRASVYKSYLEPVRGRPNLIVTTYAFVTKILINSDSVAYGVEYEYRGEKRTAFASKEVILSAGALQSPHILMLSGVGNKTELDSLGISVLKDLPGVGETLMDHVAITDGVRFKATRLIRKELSDPIRAGVEDWRAYSVPGNRTGPLTSCPVLNVVFMNVDGDNNRPDLQIISFKEIQPGEGCSEGIPGHPGFFTTVSFTIGLCHPKSVGHLSLRDANPHSPPIIDLNYFDDPVDVAVMREGLKRLYPLRNDKSLRDAGFEFDTTPLPGCEHVVPFSDEYWNCVIRTLTGTLFHQSCTCHMGPQSDPLAVVDPELRVYGITHLRVIDASVMPKITTANLNAPVIMIAERAADLIKETWPAEVIYGNSV